MLRLKRRHDADVDAGTLCHDAAAADCLYAAATRASGIDTPRRRRFDAAAAAYGLFYRLQTYYREPNIHISNTQLRAMMRFFMRLMFATLLLLDAAFMLLRCAMPAAIYAAPRAILPLLLLPFFAPLPLRARCRLPLRRWPLLRYALIRLRRRCFRHAYAA